MPSQGVIRLVPTQLWRLCNGRTPYDICTVHARHYLQSAGAEPLIPSPQLQRRLLHIHCSGASRIHASNCSCIWVMVQRMSSA